MVEIFITIIIISLSFTIEELGNTFSAINELLSPRTTYKCVGYFDIQMSLLEIEIGSIYLMAEDIAAVNNNDNIINVRMVESNIYVLK